MANKTLRPEDLKNGPECGGNSQKVCFFPLLYLLNWPTDGPVEQHFWGSMDTQDPE